MNKHEILLVKQIGEQIGYGNLMYLASSLWRICLTESETPINGAFVPALLFQLKKKEQPRAMAQAEIFDNGIKELINPKDSLIDG